MANQDYQHLLERVSQRVDPNDMQTVAKTLESFNRNRIKTRKVPNESWYKEINSGSKTVAIVCGQGVHISTVLTPDMTPVGKKI